MPNQIDPAKLEAELASFTGTSEWFRNFTGLVFTEGVHHLAREAGAYWLIDAIGSHQLDSRLRTPALKQFQLWTLHVNPDHSAVLSCYADGDGTPAVLQQELEFTDFPLDSIRLFVEQGVLLLPSEH